jgi:hypothetical protein
MNNLTYKDYVLIENPNEDFYGIELKTGKWQGVRYIYGKVSIKESPELDTATMSFSYTITDSTEKYEEAELIGDINFKNHLGDILNHCIQDSLDNKKAEIGHINTNPDTRTKSSN